MPIFDYQCVSCGHQMEAMQKLSEAPLTKCPECHEPQLLKMVSAPSFRLGGSGWYETDFKDGKKKNLVEKENNSDTAKAPACGSGSCGCH